MASVRRRVVATNYHVIDFGGIEVYKAHNRRTDAKVIVPHFGAGMKRIFLFVGCCRALGRCGECAPL